MANLKDLCQKSVIKKKFCENTVVKNNNDGHEEKNYDI
jgi:hypothetical protein